MKTSILKLIVLSFALSLAGCASKTEIKGHLVFNAPPEDVFIIGRDRVKVVSEEEMDAFSKKVEARIAALEAKSAGVPEDSRPTYEHGSFGLRELRDLKALQEVTTDEEGNFSLTVPAKGRVALIVEARRQIKHTDASPNFYWIVWVPLDDRKTVDVTLNNDN